MSKFFARNLALLSLGVAFIASPAARAELPAHKFLPLTAALAVAQGAHDACVAQGYRVSVTIVGAEGQALVSLRGDGASPHTLENSQRKAYTSRTFRAPSGDIAQRVKDNPSLGLVHLSGVIAIAGALPIKAGEETIGAVGVSGAPGGDKDEACAKAGIDKIADQLK
ncbi:heme-binding protein [Methylosinus sp. Sm6]|uniref:GlcG/HbpS family heme-binding protein n=1 Tax=Methylosinus sp. Sm6 TaxID=2866948 RepID=UPI001C99C5FE|nr:heme-binding protein [Methylosinus sp. Sm6]MBY6242229.1 heme-binding protein [Methylosinus sp. Sm6]